MTNDWHEHDSTAWDAGYTEGYNDGLLESSETVLKGASAAVLWVWEDKNVKGNLAKFAAAYRLVVLAEARAKVQSAGFCTCQSCLRPVEQIDVLMQAETVREQE